MRVSPVKILASLEQYLEFEEKSQIRHEFVDGFLFEMAGASEPHNLIAGNIFVALKLAARGKPCRVFQSDMKVLANNKVYYPDVFVTCNPDDLGQPVKHHPCLIVEVLSNSTADIDRNEKWENYQKISDLQMYVLVHQDKSRVEVYKRQFDQTWQYVSLEDQAKLEFACTGALMTLEAIFEDVEFSK